MGSRKATGHWLDDEPPPYRPIESYGVIGDLHTVALVGMDGSINFMCFPEFDSPSMFASLLDRHVGGRFRLAPVLEDVRAKQIYLPDTCVLLTRFLSQDGVAEISDFMPVEEVGPVHNLIRRAKTVRGEIRFRMVCQPRFDYARATHHVEQTKDSIVFVSDGPDKTAVRLRSSVPLRVHDGDVLKATYMLTAAVGWAFGFAFALERLPGRWWTVAVAVLGVLALAQLPFLVY